MMLSLLQLFDLGCGRWHERQVLKVKKRTDGCQSAQKGNQGKVPTDTIEDVSHFATHQKGGGNPNLVEIQCNCRRCGAFVGGKPLSREHGRRALEEWLGSTHHECSNENNWVRRQSKQRHAEYFGVHKGEIFALAKYFEEDGYNAQSRSQRGADRHEGRGGLDTPLQPEARDHVRDGQAAQDIYQQKFIDQPIGRSSGIGLLEDVGYAGRREAYPIAEQGQRRQISQLHQSLFEDLRL